MPAICHYPKSDQYLSSLEINFNINPPIYTQVIQVVSFSLVSPSNPRTQLPSSPTVPHAQTISLFWSLE